MTIRVIVPLTWESDLRRELFLKLKELGYTWSKGDPLDSDQEKMHNMAYVAIFINQPIVKFSSKIELGEKPKSEHWYNYFLTYPDVDKVLQSINFIKQYLDEDQDEYEIENFIMSHHSLKDSLLLI